MEKIKECPECKSTEFKTFNNKDVKCSKCGVLLVRKYMIDSSYFLQKNMSIEDIKTEIQNCVYRAACIIEALEHIGFYQGNGHHAAQDIAVFAVDRFMKGVIKK